MKTGGEKWRWRRERRKKRKKRYIKGEEDSKAREKATQHKPKAKSRKTMKQNIEK